ncbi:MAG TPA: hypothetical protein VHE12_06560 [bacterium]|nr:hypothetical protein [bacterium]
MRKAWVMALGLTILAAGTMVRAHDMDKDGGAKKATLTGTLVDVACYLGDNETGNDHMGMKKCGTECLKSGSPAGLLVDKKLYVLAFPASAFAEYVGKQLELTGEVYPGDVLIPKKAAEVDKDGKKKNINIRGKAMM